MSELDLQVSPSSGAELVNTHDFCSLLFDDLEPLYLLAYLLTADSEAAQACLLATVETFEHGALSREQAMSHVKDRIVAHAVRSIFSGAAGHMGALERMRGLERKPEQGLCLGALEGVTQLPALERFAYVLTILERYTIAECAAVLACETRSVVQLQTKALRRLTALHRASLQPLAPPVFRDDAAAAGHRDLQIFY